MQFKSFKYILPIIFFNILIVSAFSIEPIVPKKKPLLKKIISYLIIPPIKPTNEILNELLVEEKEKKKKNV